MSAVDDLLRNIPIPKLVDVKQIFPRPVIKDAAGTLAGKLQASGLLSGIKPGQSIAITAGSRGIANIPAMLKVLVDEVKKAGGKPFVFPAMGSHGGATAEGQKSMLEGMGITEDYLGAPIRATMDTVQIGVSSNGRPVFIDEFADEADGIIVINRIKPHTSFRGKYESGLMKMITIGMGKQHGADFAHMLGFGQMAESVPAIAREVIAKKNIICAVGVIENAYHETAQIEVLPSQAIETEEPVLLKRAWELYPRLFFDKLDVLILDEIGKDISGTGFDTNILGRYHTPYASGGPDITKIAVLDVTEKSHGNANGAGMLDFTTRRLFDKMSFEQTYPNALTSTVPTSVKIPMVLKNDMQAIQAAIKTCNILDRTSVKLARIKNTTQLDVISVSESLVPYVREHASLELAGEPYSLTFNSDGNLF